MAIVLTGIVSPTDTDAPLAAPTRITMTTPDRGCWVSLDLYQVQPGRNATFDWSEQSGIPVSTASGPL
jgi:hypothetical protein